MLKRFILIPALLLAACSSTPVDDFQDESVPLPLSELKSPIKVERVWARRFRDAATKHFVRLPLDLSQQQVLVTDVSGAIKAYDQGKGTPLWQHNVDKLLTGGFSRYQGVAYFGTGDAQVVALDLATKSELWRVAVSSEVLTRPAVDDKQVVVQTVDGKVQALDRENGKQRWLYERSVPALSLRGGSSPVIVDQVVLVGFSSGKLLALNLTNGEPQWEATVANPRGRTDLERMVDVDAELIVDNGLVYAVSYQGRVAAVLLETGRVLWVRDISSYAGMVLAGRYLYVADSGGRVWALDKDNGTTLWRQGDLRGRGLTAPAVMGNYLIVGDYQGYLHWLSLEDGSLVGRHRVVYEDYFVHKDREEQGRLYGFDEDIAVNSAPVVLDDRLYAASNDGVLAAFRIVP